MVGLKGVGRRRRGSAQRGERQLGQRRFPGDFAVVVTRPPDLTGGDAAPQRRPRLVREVGREAVHHLERGHEVVLLQGQRLRRQRDRAAPGKVRDLFRAAAYRLCGHPEVGGGLLTGRTGNYRTYSRALVLLMLSLRLLEMMSV